MYFIAYFSHSLLSLSFPLTQFVAILVPGTGMEP